MRLIDLDERASHGEAQGACLTSRAAAVDIRLHIVSSKCVRRRERLLNGCHERRARKVITQGATVDVPFAGARLHVHPTHRFLSAADRVDGLSIRHVTSHLRG